MIKRLCGFLLISALFITACVTVNIYFPAAAAEEAADKIIQDIQRTPSVDQTPEPEARRLYRTTIGFNTLLNLGISSAYASANLNIDTPEIRRLKASMQKRFAELKPYYDKGWVGLTRDGLIAVRTMNEVPLRDRNRLQNLVEAENNDRKALYRAIAVANGQPEWQDEIQATFAERWIGNAQKGWYFETPQGQWKQK